MCRRTGRFSAITQNQHVETTEKKKKPTMRIGPDQKSCHDSSNLQSSLRPIFALAVMTCVHCHLILSLNASQNFYLIYYGSGDRSTSLLAFVVSPLWMILPLLKLSLFQAKTTKSNARN
jgi:hypothetical protein